MIVPGWFGLFVFSAIPSHSPFAPDHFFAVMRHRGQPDFAGDGKQFITGDALLVLESRAD
jgi:hypothetical protein